MKTIIAGGRSYSLTPEDYDKLDNINITEVVSGMCEGADLSGAFYAHMNKIPIKRFPASWQEYGKAAGPIRNRKMAQYADAVVLFPGGKGTQSMKQEAIKAGIKIFDYSQNE